MKSEWFRETASDRIDGGESLEFGVVHAGAAVVLFDFVVPEVAGEAVGVFYGGGAAFIAKERAERVVGVVILHRARIVDQHSNAAEAVVQVVIYVVVDDARRCFGIVGNMVLGQDLIMRIDIGLFDLRCFARFDFQ